MRVIIKNNSGEKIITKENVKAIEENIFGNIQLIFENGKTLTLQKRLLKIEKVNTR